MNHHFIWLVPASKCWDLLLFCHLWLKMKSLGCCSCDFRTYWKKMSDSLVRNCSFLLKCLVGKPTSDQSNVSKQKNVVFAEDISLCFHSTKLSVGFLDWSRFSQVKISSDSLFSLCVLGGIDAPYLTDTSCWVFVWVPFLGCVNKTNKKTRSLLLYAAQSGAHSNKE